MIGPINQAGLSWKRAGDTALNNRYQASTQQETIDAVEPVSSASPWQRERRASEARANGQALNMGIVAQLISSHDTMRNAALMPLPPATRTAARYETTAQGADLSMSLGFSRAI
ncbi:MAG: hypothetical protein AAF590_06505 [Pseudomonadota bacterium]